MNKRIRKDIHVEMKVVQKELHLENIFTIKE